MPRGLAGLDERSLRVLQLERVIDMARPIDISELDGQFCRDLHRLPLARKSPHKC